METCPPSPWREEETYEVAHDGRFVLLPESLVIPYM